LASSVFLVFRRVTQGFQFGLEPLDPGEPRIRLLAGLLGCVPLLVELGL